MMSKEYFGYTVYEDGSVYSNISKRFMKHGLCGSQGNYHFFGLTTAEGFKQMYKHRLVAILFVENPDNKPHVNHIDRNTDNNHYTNLEWVTPKENINHSIKCGESPIKNFRETILMKNGKMIGEFESKIAMARFVGDNGGSKSSMDKQGWDSNGFVAMCKY